MLNELTFELHKKKSQNYMKKSKLSEKMEQRMNMYSNNFRTVIRCNTIVHQ